MKLGSEWPDKYNLDSLRVLGSVGEPLNPEAFEWFYHVIGKDRCPIVDTWWQTETGMHMVTTVLGEPMRPGYVGKSIPGIVADVVDKDGKSVAPGKSGFLVIRQPWPAMMRTIWNNDERYRRVLGNDPRLLRGGRPCDQGGGRVHHGDREIRRPHHCLRPQHRYCRSGECAGLPQGSRRSGCDRETRSPQGEHDQGICHASCRPYPERETQERV